jgi:phosphatidate phosphatase APP1
MLSLFKGKQPKKLLCYACISNGESLFLRLRIVKSSSDIKFSKKDSVFSHVKKVLRLFLSRSTKTTEVTLSINGKKHVLKTSRRGFIEKTIKVKLNDKNLSIFLKGNDSPFKLDVDFINPSSKIIVSDLDDTILKSQATNLFKLILKTLIRPLNKRHSFEGASEYYNLKANEGYKIIYVSSSTWDLYPFIKDFIYEFGFPEGPILLQNTRDKKISNIPHHQKFDYLMEITNLVGQGEMILIGDEGQRDPEIYLEISKRFPSLVKRILIRKSWWTTKEDSEHHLKRASNQGTEFKYFSESSQLL